MRVFGSGATRNGDGLTMDMTDPGLRYAKPEPRVLDKITLRRQREAQASAFRRAVWKRDGSRCRNCDRLVRQTCELVPDAGHVHHRHGRNVAPEHRYTVAQAVLLCARCHADSAVIQRFRNPRARALRRTK